MNEQRGRESWEQGERRVHQEAHGGCSVEETEMRRDSGEMCRDLLDFSKEEKWRTLGHSGQRSDQQVRILAEELQWPVAGMTVRYSMDLVAAAAAVVVEAGQRQGPGETCF